MIRIQQIESMVIHGTTTVALFVAAVTRDGLVVAGSWSGGHYVARHTDAGLVRVSQHDTCDAAIDRMLELAQAPSAWGGFLDFGRFHGEF